MTEKHTPTPWRVLRGVNTGNCVQDANGDRVAVFFGFSEARRNVEHTVKCVNSHEKLVAALAFAASVIKCGEAWTGDCEEKIGKVLKEVRRLSDKGGE